MPDTARTVQRTYLLLTLLTTLAASFIWGINTLFLLDAGLTNTEAFAANAFFAVGTVIFEVPTGVIADTRGRRFSFLLGAATLLASTVLYLVMWQIKAPFLGWAAASAVLGLGFTFFSGATEAWLVDALGATGFTGSLETVFGRAQTVGGAAMLVGSVAGGVIAQATDLGVPYLLRAGMLGVTLVVAWWFMRDIGFTARRGAGPVDETRVVVRGAVDGGLRNPPVRWLMLAAPFTSGVGFFAFYAMQPYLLELYGDSGAYSVAGLAAAIVAGAQIVGGLIVPWVRRLFRRRTDALILGTAANVAILALIGLTDTFVVALVLLALWAMVFAVQGPVRQAFINGLIPSSQRATVLSFDSLVGSTGGVVAQPALGRVADIGGYSASYLVSAVVTSLALPFMWLARRERAASDPMAGASAGPPPGNPPRPTTDWPYSTTSVPTIPASSCPGTVHRKRYVPGASMTKRSEVVWPGRAPASTFASPSTIQSWNVPSALVNSTTVQRPAWMRISVGSNATSRATTIDPLRRRIDRAVCGVDAPSQAEREQRDDPQERTVTDRGEAPATPDIEPARPRLHAPETQRVRHDRDTRERHRRGGERRVQGHARERIEDAHGDRDEQHVVGEGPEQVLADRAQGRPRQLDGGGHQARIAAHERDVGRLDGDVGAGPDGDADVRLGQCRCVVDAVADHGHAMPLGLQGLDDRSLVAGEHLGMDPRGSIPTRRATDSAVARASPVSIQTVSPCASRVRIASIASALIGSAMASIPASWPSTATYATVAPSAAWVAASSANGVTSRPRVASIRALPTATARPSTVPWTP